MNFIVTPAKRKDIERTEKTGECYKSIDNKHFYLIRDNDVLHVTNGCINTLYDNKLTADRHTFNSKFILIQRSEFNNILNNTIFELDYFGKDYKNK